MVDCSADALRYIEPVIPAKSTHVLHMSFATPNILSCGGSGCSPCVFLAGGRATIRQE